MYLGLAILMGTAWLRLSYSQENIQNVLNALFFGSAFMSFMVDSPWIPFSLFLFSNSPFFPLFPNFPFPKIYLLAWLDIREASQIWRSTVARNDAETNSLIRRLLLNTGISYLSDLVTFLISNWLFCVHFFFFLSTLLTIIGCCVYSCILGRSIFHD